MVRVAVILVVLAAVAVGALVWWWPLSSHYLPPTAKSTAALDERAREIITVWDRRFPRQPARRYLPAAPHLPDRRMGWTFRYGHDPRPGRDAEIERAIGEGMRATKPLPETVPAGAAVRWEDGTAVDVPLISAAEAFDEVQAEKCLPARCDQTLRVTGAELAAVPARTAHGWASIPAWLFSIADTPVQVARIAARVEPTPGNTSDRFQRSGVEYATVDHGQLHGQRLATTDGSPDPGASTTTLTVEFPGAPPGNGPCQSEYTAHAIEGAAAVVVIVQPMRKPGWVRDQVECAPISGYDPLQRQTVHLSRPLGERVLLDISDGLPRMVSEPPPWP